METRCVVSGFACILGWAPHLSAQTTMRVLHGDAAGDHFGAEVALVGDVDGDGVEDWAVGAPGANAGPLVDVGQVNVYSGRNQSLVRAWQGAAARDHFGAALARAGDVDGDGFDDVAVGAPQYDEFAPAWFGPGYAEVRSGATGAVLLHFAVAGSGRLGFAVDGGHDIDADGVPDLLVGDPDANSCLGAVYAVSGANGATIHAVNGTSSSFGHGVAFLGDLDGDGRAEFAVGEPNVCLGTIFDGRVSVHDGLTGALIWSATGVPGNCGDEYGWSVERSPDMSGDGRADVLIGGRDTNCFAGGGAGFLDARDGLTGALLLRVTPSAPGFSGYGAGIAGLRDLDGDGVPEVAVGAPGEVSGVNEDVLVCSGANAQTLVALPPPSSTDAWGHALGAFDATDDGLDDLIVGAPRSDAGGPDAGAVLVFTIVRASTSYCDAETNSLGCTPAIAGLGTPSATSPVPFDVRATNVLNGKVGLCFYGYKPRRTPFQGGSMCITAPFQRTPLQGSGGSVPPAADCTGTFSLDFNARIQGGVDPLLVAGAQVYAQYWSRDPADPSTTNLTDALAFYVHP